VFDVLQATDLLSSDVCEMASIPCRWRPSNGPKRGALPGLPENFTHLSKERVTVPPACAGGYERDTLWVQGGVGN